MLRQMVVSSAVAVLLLSAVALAQTTKPGATPAAKPAATPAVAVPVRTFDKAWHINLPRETMLAAWDRLKKVEIPGVPVDQRFKIDGPTFYVSPKGDDAADGSKERPWKTLIFAAGKLKPGSVICLTAGTYYGPVEVKTKATAEAPAAIRAMEGQEVIVTYPPEFVQEQQAKIAKIGKEGAEDKDGKALHYSSIISVNGSYVEVSGLHLVGVRDKLPMNLYSESGISFVGGGGVGCRALYNEIENVGHCGVKEMGHGGKDILIEGNYIHDIGITFHDHGAYIPANDVTLRKNIITNAAGWGVHAYSSPQRIVVSHNIIGGNDQDSVIIGGADAKVLNNILYKDHNGGVFFFRSGCKNALVANNVFIEPEAFRYDSAGSNAPDALPHGSIIDYNCLANGTKEGKPSPGDTVGSHNIKANPMFVDMAKWDFHLLPASPCIDAGDPKSMEKFSGKAPDIGLYEMAK